MISIFGVWRSKKPGQKQNVLFSLEILQKLIEKRNKTARIRAKP